MPQSLPGWRSCCWGCRGWAGPGVHQAKMIEWNMWARDFPVPYQGDFAPKVPQICDCLRAVDGDLPDDIDMRRYDLNDYQKEKAPGASGALPQAARP